MSNPLFIDGKPDINAIRTYFPQHQNGRIRHKTSLGDNFLFFIGWNGSSGYTIIIEEQPGYAGQATDLHSTHRLHAGSGRYQVCVRREPCDLPTAVTVAIWWAECTSKYIRNGGAW